MVIQIVLKAVPKIGQASWKVLVPLGVGAAAAVGAGVKGSIDTAKGHRIRKGAKNRLDDAIAGCETTRVMTEQVAHEYGEFQMRTHQETVVRLADWLEKNEHLVKRLNFKKVDGVRIQIPNIPQYIAGVKNVTRGISGLASAVGAGVSAQAAALWGVSTFASASTGTAISSLSGAAAQNATLAWLGGGALASGGGGVAAGGIVLGLVAVVPALLIGGMTLGVVGAQAKTKSHDFAATVEIEIERVGITQDLLGAAQQRIEELQDLLIRLKENAIRSLDALEACAFDPELHASEFLRAYQFVTAVKEVLNTPVLDPDSGEISEASITILRKYP